MSIKLNPTAACLNNRALTSLKLKKYQQAINDTTESLQFEKTYKAYLRRALAEFHMGRYQEATVDVTACLEINKTKEALDLKKMVLEKWSDVDGSIGNQSLKPKKNRMKIVEVDEESEAKMENAPKTIDINSNTKKVKSVIDYDFDSSKGPKIMEIESDDEKVVEVVPKGVNFIDVEDDDSDSDESDKEIEKVNNKGDSKVTYACNDSDDDE
jgi:tetratricopeptide (TPR) repeat protein